MKALTLALSCTLLATSLAPLQAKLKLGELFADNMVLQRDTDAPVWGTADPGEAVAISIGDQTATATTAADGRWQATLHGLKLGPALTLTVKGAKDTLTVKNVAIGDVWVTSGQSNMQYLLIDQDEIALPPNPDLHYFECPRSMTLQPAAQFPNGKYAWMTAAPDTRARMSAVAYYFAKNLNKELGVPIGIVDCTWGGTPGEAWTPREKLESMPEYKDAIDRALTAFQDSDARVKTYADDHAAWEKANGRADPGNKGFTDGWASPTFDDSKWKTIKTSTFSAWNSIGMPDGGAAWMRKTVTLPPEAVGKDFTISISEIHGADTVYFNGVEVGHAGWNAPWFLREHRNYKVPGSLVKGGPNVVAIRIFTQRSDHAFILQKEKLTVPVADPAALDDAWKAEVEYKLPPMTPDVAASEPPSPHAPAGCVPAINFNSMVCPLIPFAIKGALWYQGESNTNFGYAYRSLLPMLIEGWRAHWKRGDFPFYIVQLPNLGKAQTTPIEPAADWAVMRESQLMTWKKVPHTAMSVSIDIGEAANLHPPDKKDVGLRLSLIALADTYGKPIEYSGPLYDSMTVEGNKVRLKFTHLGGGLVSKDGGPLKHFAIAGSDQNWVDGTAEIDGDSVVVSSPSVATPVAVRYAWAANPDGCNLVNKAGLPASPFRTDDWQVATQGEWWYKGAPPHADDVPLAPLVYPAAIEVGAKTADTAAH